MNISFWFYRCNLSNTFVSNIYEIYGYQYNTLDVVPYIIPEGKLSPCVCRDCIENRERDENHSEYVIIKAETNFFAQALLSYNPVAIEIRLFIEYPEYQHRQESEPNDSGGNSNNYLQERLYKFTYIHPFITRFNLENIRKQIGIGCTAFITTTFNVIENQENKSIIKLHIVKLVNCTDSVSFEEKCISDEKRIEEVVVGITKCKPYHICSSRIIYYYS